MDIKNAVCKYCNGAISNNDIRYMVDMHGSYFGVLCPYCQRWYELIKPGLHNVPYIVTQENDQSFGMMQMIIYPPGSTKEEIVKKIWSSVNMKNIMLEVAIR